MYMCVCIFEILECRRLAEMDHVRGVNIFKEQWGSSPSIEHTDWYRIILALP